MMLRITSFATILFFAAAPALAIGSGTSGGAPPTGINKVHKCKAHKVWSTKRHKCVKRRSAEVTDDDVFETGRLLAQAGDYDGAILVLSSAQNANDPRILNYMGYSNRKAGRFDIALSYYNQALTIDPDFVLAREYLGEGYAATGRIELAKAQLTEIATRCGVSCEEYADLAEAIKDASP